jgi:predicted nucleotidyltransferase
MQHHHASVAAFIHRVSDRPDLLGIVLAGSVARGTERPDSDVDAYLVLTEDGFAEAVRTNRVSWVERDGVTYDGGYYDLKVASLDYLSAATERGDDAVRASFAGARVVWSRVDDLAERIARIPRLPEDVWREREASYLAQARLHGGYFSRQAAELDNLFLRHHAGVHLVGAGGRALLALNRTLFQGQKYLQQTVASLPRLPDGYADLAATVLQAPSPDSAAAYLAALEGLHDWPLNRDATLSTFVRDTELAWLTRRPTPEYA